MSTHNLCFEQKYENYQNFLSESFHFLGTHNLCFEQKYENYQNFLSESFHFLVVKFSIYLNRRVFVMNYKKNISMKLF